jgi:NAD(P)-dependent dehydrogenase (short-subunit alcohol dehydrogenase family)
MPGNINAEEENNVSCSFCCVKELNYKDKRMGISYTKEIETKWFGGFVEQLPDLQGKVIAVTGCTTGLGYVFARTCIEKHAAAVILLNRSSERAEAAEKSLKEIANSDTTIVETIACDLQDFDSVRKAAAQLAKKYEALDVLCNNAGIMAFPDEATVDGYDVQMQTNYLSHFLLTKELFPLLQKAKEKHGSARIVNHSSFMRNRPQTPLEKKYMEKTGGDLGGSGPKAMWERYHQTKLANSVFTCALQDRLKGSGILATVAAPGYSYTDLQSTSPGMSGLLLWSRPLMAQSVADGCMPLLAATFLSSSSTTERAMIWEPCRMRLTGPAAEYELEETSTKKEYQDMLWAASEEACGKFDI